MEMYHHRRIMCGATAGVLGLVCSMATAVPVGESTLRINGTGGNRTDFGLGPHSGGLPAEGARISWDYRVVGGQIMASATVVGTYYLDAFDAGITELTIEFHDLNGNLISNDARVVFTKFGIPFSLFGAADGSHQQSIVPLTVEGTNLHSVFVQTRTLDLCCPHAIVSPFVNLNSRSAPRNKTYQHHVVGGAVGFGKGSSNNNPYNVSFERTNGSMKGRVDGTLYWSGSLPGHPRMRIHWQRRDGTILFTKLVEFNAPGRNLNPALNQLAVDTFFSSGELWQILLIIGSVDSQGKFVETTRPFFTFDGGVQPGTFDVAPAAAEVAVNERQHFAFSWTVPEPQNWHDLSVLQLRLNDQEGTAVRVVFDEASNSFSLLDEATGDLAGSATPGSTDELQLPPLTLYMAETSVEAHGAASPSVTLNLSLSLGPTAAGREFDVEVSAGPDEGVQSDFVRAGKLTVRTSDNGAISTSGSLCGAGSAPLLLFTMLMLTGLDWGRWNRLR